MSLSNSEIIRNRIDFFLPALSKFFTHLLEQPNTVEAYGNYLILLHGFVRASVPLMEDAIFTLKKYPDSDPFKICICNYLASHIEEEKDHDKWLLDDLELIGINKSKVISKLPSRHIAAMVGSQYYWIRHHHPFLLLGYIAVLEGNPPTIDCINRLKESTGLPINAFRTLVKHAELDPNHNKDMDKLLDQMPLTKSDIDAICICASSTIAYTVEAFDEFSPKKYTD